MTRAGGVALANVLVNGTFAGVGATLAKVALTLVSTSNANLTLSTTSSSVSIARGIPAGTHTLVYRICEIDSPANCDSATVTVVVTGYVIDAVDDYARGSSKGSSTPLASVLDNDTLGGLPAYRTSRIVIFRNKIKLNRSCNCSPIGPRLLRFASPACSATTLPFSRTRIIAFRDSISN